MYLKTVKIGTREKNYCNCPKSWLMWIFHRVMHEDGLAYSIDPDQTALLVAVWSWSTLFDQTYLSENLGSLQ